MCETRFSSPIGRARGALTDGVTCVAVRGSKTMTSSQRGIAPVVRWLDEDADCLRGAYIADRVVGKAAALLFAYAGVAGVYAQVISQLAVSTLKLHAIPYQAGRVVDYIDNRDKTGRCPMETRSLSMQSPEEAFRVFRNLVMNPARDETADGAETAVK